MSEEAVASFGVIIESVPGWIAGFDDILRSVTEKQTELLSFQRPCGSYGDALKERPVSRPVSRQGSFKQASPSSGRFRDDISLKLIGKSTSPSNSSSEVQQQRPQVYHLDVRGLTQRKRKTRSSISSHSGPPKYRSRNQNVVYYDGDAQKGFEKMVRNIGTCRNGIRKGKMTARIELLTRSGSSSSSDRSRNSREYDSSQIPKLGYKSTRELSPVSEVFGRDQETVVFDMVDKCLEASQSLCEKAAYQLLRDGDCEEEINIAKEKCIEARRLAEAGLPRLRKNAEKAARRRKEEEEAEARKAASQQLKQHDPDGLQACSQEALVPAASPIAFDNALEVDPDVDDEDSDDEKRDSAEEMSVEVMKVPLGKFRQTRQLGGRLAPPALA